MVTFARGRGANASANMMQSPPSNAAVTSMSASDSQKMSGRVPMAALLPPAAAVDTAPAVGETSAHN
jgi:hypothetical protein